MSIHEWVDQEIVRLTDVQAFGEDAFPDAELDELEILDTAEALSYVEAHIRAARQLQGWLKDRLTEQIGPKRSMKYGNTLFRVFPKRTVKVADPVAFASWLGPDLVKVFRLDGSNLRKTGLSRVVDERDADAQVIADTFLEITEGEYELRQVPVNKAPNFLADLDDGEIK